MKKDPEMMREAQKLMQSPEFQAQMKTMAETPGFKKSIQKTQDIMKDPKKLEEVQGKMDVALKKGNEELKTFNEEQDKKKSALPDGEKKDAKKGDDDAIPNIEESK